MTPAAFPWHELPAIGAAEHRALGALAALLPGSEHARWADFAAGLGGVDVALRWLSVVPAGALDADGLGCTLALDVGGAQSVFVSLELVLARVLARTALGLPLDELDAPRPLGPAEQGALDLVVSLAADPRALVAAPSRDELDERARPRALTMSLGSARRWGIVEAAIEVAGRRGRAQLWVPDPEELVERVPAFARQVDVARACRLLAQAACELRVEVAAALITREALARLSEGDVVALGGQRSGGLGARSIDAHLGLEHGGFPASLTEECLEITGPFVASLRAAGAHGKGSEEMASSDSSRARSASGSAVDEVQVELVCEVGRVRMTVAEVAQLAPGAVVALDRPLRGAVDLVAGGRLVARGELVDVEGRLGVRVRELVG